MKEDPEDPEDLLNYDQNEVEEVFSS